MMSAGSFRSSAIRDSELRDRAEIMRDVLTLHDSFVAAEEEFESLESLPRDLPREYQAASASWKS